MAGREQKEAQTAQLQNLIRSAQADILEKGVDEGVKLLGQLRASMVPTLTENPDAQEWANQIVDLAKQATKARTVIGVVGTTGAGKSSVINSILDRERLVPTNCMRACTAVVTEISYNAEDIPYRAEIEFIQSSAWEKELKILFQDLLDGDGNISKESGNVETDAGIAYAKIAAVYPTRSREDMANSSVDSLLREVSHLLGGVHKIVDTNPAPFYTRLRKLVDSKEKNRSVKSETVNERAEEIAYWPLIKVVRIFVKSPVLTTGLVLVDLPGVRDANAARAAVAEEYMKQCNGLFIVAPINRAVDDKTAQSLLGQAFKRQLKMDGGIGSVTFICSKTDDIDETEAQESLDLDDILVPLRDRSEKLRSEKEALERELKTLKSSKTSYSKAMDDLDDQIEYWQAMVEDINDGLETLAPRPEPDSKHRARKRRRLSNDADPDSHNKSEDVDPPTIKYEDDSKHQSITGHPLRVEEFKIKIAKLRATRKDARKSKVDIDLEVRVIRGKQDEIQMAESELVSETTSACISGRNDYIKATIRRDYAIEIKELDLDLAAEADEDSGPREDLRDYDVLARDFPVFCVSSRGYQKLKGWLGTGKSAVAFKSLEETEIPLLQKHCVRLTEPGRVANSQHFLVKLTQLLNSLALWASGGNVDNGLTAEQKATRERQLAKSMDHLKRDFEQTVKDTVEELHKGLKESIFVRYEVAVQTAADSAMGTIQHWAKPVDKEDHALGGFYWNTYQAICRRDGVYKFKKQPIDWNDALATPMTKKIIPGWEEMFTHRLAPVMALFALRLADVITVCHREIEREAGTLRVNDHALRMLQRQVDGYAAVFDGHAQAIKGSINSAQKTINRQFVLIIKNVLRPVYAACANEHGFKTYTRMKEHMHSYMQNKGFSMFRDSVDDVRRRLLQLITEQEKAMSNRVNGVFDAVRRDYVSVLIGGNVPNAARLREARQEMRREVMELLESTDHIFEKVLSQPQKSTLEEAEGGELQHVRTDAAQAAGEEAFA